jgi:hypothetical protein
MDPNNVLAYDLLAAVFYQKKMPAEAFTALDKRNRLEGMFSHAEMAEMRKAYETAGLSAYFKKKTSYVENALLKENISRRWVSR